MIGSTIDWLVNNIDRAILCRKEDLKHIRPGAIAANEPKILWVKMLRRQYNTELHTKQNPVDALVDVYNDLLEEILSAKRGHFLIDINQELKGLTCCTAHGTLSGYGKVKYWREVDKIIEKIRQI